MPLTLPPPGKEFGEAAGRYLEPWAGAHVLNTYLTIALVAMTLIAGGLLVATVRAQRVLASVKPLVIRVDEVGRATALTYDALAYTPQAPELKYFLIQFITKYYARLRATVRDDYAQSLLYLDGRLADATIEANRTAQPIETFLVKGSEEIDIAIRNVTLEDLRRPPYKATVEFDKVYRGLADHRELRRERYVAHVEFVLKDQVPHNLLPVNPLGLTITYFRDDQAFQ